MRASSLASHVFAGALIFAVATRGWADASSHRAAAVELLEVTHIDKITNDAIDVMLKAQLQANPDIRPYEDLMRAFLAKYMAWDALRDKYVDIYIDTYSEDELRAITDFYRTPLGQKLLASLPQVMQRGADLGREAIASHLDELKAQVKARAEASSTSPKTP